ncbi:phosphonoacetate hydrolase [Phytoactinopolyspora alkaliphila]|uniref:Phosphonoacetate hydrolase n=1 Tax=Phytoactinopolyspora alkaliphila TaxID=1783498 RepID=A0A6N9YSB4_9ACTN|nr:phosphonoacetate hydrolase [Phytoactinopolyspora alkaliphila]NED97827.1 phosphonoacetate hydrolase [Phytoactinopolyspora alkaliphila]
MSSQSEILVNGRTYRYPRRPVVVVCIDGSEPHYHEKAIAAGRMPFLSEMLGKGADWRGDSAMPSFTNPNNLSIATGSPPAVHGICGNYFFDREQGVEVMMNEPRFLRARTIFAAFEEAGATVAVVTAKDKLRRLLGDGLTRGICFSAEKADTATVAEHGIDGVLDLVGLPLPSVYSSDLSEFAMAAGVKILESRRPDLTYISLTDFVQHKYAPGTPEADDFYGMLDGYFAHLDALGAVLVVTADHGMNAKTTSSGAPQVLYLQEHLDVWFGTGRTRVVLPITDPYTVHHGALGSFAFVSVDGALDSTDAGQRLAALGGVDLVLSRREAADRFELPEDRIGDLTVIAERDVALGTAAHSHDLSQLDRPLRSHGGLTEQRVPILVNRPAALPEGHHLRNYDAYWIALNLVDHQA